MESNANYTPPVPVKPKKHRAQIIIFAIILPLLWFGGGTLAFANIQNIGDQITAWQYPLASNVATLANEAGLNSHGKFLLQISRAQLDDSAQFNQNCQIKETQAILLGCYSDQRIYVFDVTDSQISGIKSVIAAHEMLHAAYQRLSSGERAQVNAMIAAEIPHIQNQEILSLMKIYAQTEPGQEYNELHSLLATEEKNLPSDLENYYKKYFSNRGDVIAAYEKYQKVFDDLNTQASDLQTKMTSEKSVIDAARTQYNSDATQLASDIAAFNSCANTTGCFASQAEFNSQRASLLSRQQTLAATKDALNVQIDQYNADVAKLNTLGVEAQKLNQSLSSQTTNIAN